MLYELIGCAVLVAGLIGLIRLLESQGKKNAENDRMKQVLDDVHTAQMVRDGLRRDGAAAKRVRERFTR